jgi:hypothetical protein
MEARLDAGQLARREPVAAGRLPQKVEKRAGQK